MTDDYIAAAERQPPSLPPLATFAESEELRGLEKVQSEARSHLESIMFLTRPPAFDGTDE